MMGLKPQFLLDKNKVLPSLVDLTNCVLFENQIVEIIVVKVRYISLI